MPDPIIHPQPLPYIDRLEKRLIAAIDLVVIHCTELPDLSTARSYGEHVRYADGTGNSGHYYIDRDGSIYAYVPIERVAHHVRGYNQRAIGIELVNRGRYPDWWDSRQQTMGEAYPAEQIRALQSLLGWLKRHYPNVRYIAGHEDLDREQIPASDNTSLRVARKLDPGPCFPWNEILRDNPWRRWPADPD